MNQHPGTIGRKVGMTQIFNADGTVDRVTIIEAPTVVVGKRTMEKDGYSALILGLDERKEKHTKKPAAGMYKKAGVTPKRVLRELRCSEEFAAGFEIGKKLPIDQIFEVGQIVDVQGVTRGRGFSGVFRRWHMAGSVMTHGSHEYKRHGGSIGTNMTPGRTLPGLKMPGHHGDKVRTALNIKIVRIMPETDMLLIDGAVPGTENGIVMVRGAVKKMGGKPKAKK
ncbi:MAG: 50S ribosomal protein L3 [Deltaproteobacteria bacterium]|nr:50S ribosomal protein L3 [Deltaproteobacteria bacterium]